MTETRAITTSREEAEKDLHYDVISNHAAVQSAKLAQQGDYTGAVATNLAYGDMMGRNIKNEQQQQDFFTYTTSTTAFNNDMEFEQQRQQSPFSGFTYNAPNPSPAPPSDSMFNPSTNSGPVPSPQRSDRAARAIYRNLKPSVFKKSNCLKRICVNIDCAK